MKNDRLSRRRFIGAAAAAAAGFGLTGRAAGQSRRPSTRAGILPGADVPWLQEVQDHEVASDAEPPVPVTAADGTVPGTLDEWREMRSSIRSRWMNYLHPIEAPQEAPAVNVVEEDRPPGAVRQLVEYECEPGEMVRGYLIKPLDIESPRPGVLVLHPTVPSTIRQPAGLRDREHDYAFGLRLAQMGCVTFTPENFLWRPPFERLVEEFHAAHPDSSMNWQAKKDIFTGVVESMQERHPETKGMGKMLFDARRALDVLESREEVDAGRLGTIGHSLGAMEVIYLAALDDRVKAAVSNEAGISTQFQNWNDPWYLGSEIEAFDHDHQELLALAAPAPFLLMGGGTRDDSNSWPGVDGPESWPYVRAALEIYRLHEEPPRLGFFNHKHGHAIPPVAEHRGYQWLLTYL